MSGTDWLNRLGRIGEQGNRVRIKASSARTISVLRKLRKGVEAQLTCIGIYRDEWSWQVLTLRQACRHTVQVQKAQATLMFDDALRALPLMMGHCIDAVVTDPPYHLTQASIRGLPGSNLKGVLKSQWDAGDLSFQVETWRAIRRVTKPGGWLVVFGHPRTFHRLACAIEDAGWELRDTLCWLYGQGTPKSFNIPAAIDRAGGEAPTHQNRIHLARHIRECRQAKGVSFNEMASWFKHRWAVRSWERLDRGVRTPTGRDYAVLVRKLGCDPSMRSFVREPVRGRVLRRGTLPQSGGWVARGHAGYKAEFVEHEPASDLAKEWDGYGTGLRPAWEPILLALNPPRGTFAENVQRHGVGGLNLAECRLPETDHRPSRWAPNVAMDESVADALGGQSGNARHFFCPKPSRRERGASNGHPTVKPLRLMEWLCRLVQPPCTGVLLDPFMGSGTTGLAAVSTGWKFVGIESDADYFDVAVERMDPDKRHCVVVR